MWFTHYKSEVAYQAGPKHRVTNASSQLCTTGTDDENVGEEVAMLAVQHYTRDENISARYDCRYLVNTQRLFERHTQRTVKADSVDPQRYLISYTNEANMFFAAKWNNLLNELANIPLLKTVKDSCDKHNRTGQSIQKFVQLGLRSSIYYLVYHSTVAGHAGKLSYTWTSTQRFLLVCPVHRRL